jgi:hypothetical protein
MDALLYGHNGSVVQLAVHRIEFIKVDGSTSLTAAFGKLHNSLGVVSGARFCANLLLTAAGQDSRGHKDRGDASSNHRL